MMLGTMPIPIILGTIVHFHYSALGDYTGVQEQLTFGPSVSEVQVSIPITDDIVYEPNTEQLGAQLTLATTGAAVDIVRPTATVDIVDNDSKPFSQSL